MDRSVNHPQADGAAERVMKVVKEALRKVCYEVKDPQAWEKALPELLLGYRCSPQASTRTVLAVPVAVWWGGPSDSLGSAGAPVAAG
jgi:hypothetical protein